MLGWQVPASRHVRTVLRLGSDLMVVVSTVGQGVSVLWKYYLDFITLLTWWEVRNVTCHLGTPPDSPLCLGALGFSSCYCLWIKKEGGSMRWETVEHPNFQSVFPGTWVFTEHILCTSSWAQGFACMILMNIQMSVFSKMWRDQEKKKTIFCFPVAMIVRQKQLQGERVGLAQSARIQAIMATKSQQQQLESFWSRNIWRQEVESDGCS